MTDADVRPRIPVRIEAPCSQWGWRVIYREPDQALLRACISKGWHDRCCAHYESTFGETFDEYDCNGECHRRIRRWQPRTFFEMALFIALSDGWGGQSLVPEVMKRRAGASWTLPDPATEDVLSCTYGLLVFREQFDALLTLCTGVADAAFAHLVYMSLANPSQSLRETTISELRGRVSEERVPLLEYILKSCTHDRPYLNLPPLFRVAEEAYDRIRASEIAPYRAPYLRLKMALAP